MRCSRPPFAFNPTVISLALLAAFSPARADDESEVAQLTRPDSSVSMGLGAVSGNDRDRARFGQYNGMRKNDVYGLFDIDWNRRDDATGTWTSLEGRNLGLDSRELRFGQQKQGDWKYFAEYGELTRRSPYTINTAELGAGTTTPTVVLLGTPGTGSNLDLKLQRKSLGAGIEKWITPHLQFEVSFKNEDKNGARLFGKGFACSAAWVADGVCASSTNHWALLMLPEPIDSTTRQIEAKLNFSNDKLALSGGYYGSFYTNANGNLTPTVPATLNNPLGAPRLIDTGLRATLGLPMALPPDNQAHQVYVSGTYAFTPKTRATFKLGYTHATQHDDFASNGLTGAPPGVSNLGGVLDTTIAQFGLSSRPIPKLAITANLRYEDRKDKTPQALYSVEGTEPFANSKYSLKKTAAKLEGSYQLPAQLRGTLGIDYEAVDRGEFTSPGCAALDADGECIGSSVAGLSGLRAKTEETSLRVELRRAMAENLSGAISYTHGDRSGSDWLKPNALPATGVTPLPDAAIFSRTAIFPMIFMDRKRNKVKLSADWSPTEVLSLQLALENGKDTYSAPTTKGLRDMSSKLYSVDAVWAVSDKWKVTAYVSEGDQEIHVDHSTGYMASLRNRNSGFGLGVTGQPTGRLALGADLSLVNDKNIYAQALDASASANNQAFFATFAGLPNVVFRQTTLKLFGTYALRKSSAIRVDLVHQRSNLDEWTWGYNGVPFVYSDGTTVSQQPRQHVTFLGVSYIYRWQ